MGLVKFPTVSATDLSGMTYVLFMLLVSLGDLLLELLLLPLDDKDGFVTIVSSNSGRELLVAATEYCLVVSLLEFTKSDSVRPTKDFGFCTSA